MSSAEKEEILEVVDREGRVLRLARRGEIHGNPELLHRVVHVLVVNGAGEILLQKRSMNKDVAPGRWDTSVGGHVEPGETLVEAARRETLEELGFGVDEPEFLYSYIHSNPCETELVHTYRVVRDNGGFDFNREEIDEVAFWSIEKIRETLGQGILSDNFEDEFRSYLSHIGVD